MIIGMFVSLLALDGNFQILSFYVADKHNAIIGTINDSIGEAFNKIARLLNLNMSNCGSPAI